MTDQRRAGEARTMGIDIDRSTPHAARMYDYVLGGTTHFTADRETVEMMGAGLDGGVDFIRALARRNRAFMARAVRHLAREAGMRQFLDLGAGIPAYDNTHEIAQAIEPTSRVVYVDHDPIVLSYAHERLRSTPEGACNYIHADFTGIDGILEAAGETLDFDEPIALMLVALLHLVGEDADPDGIVSRLLGMLPSGSYVAISHFTADFDGDDMVRLAELYQGAGGTLVMRSKDRIMGFMEGLDMLPPGLVPIDDWRPEEEVAKKVPLWGGVGKKA